MKITRIRAHQVDLPLREGSYKWSGGKSVNVFDSTVVEVETDSGVVGVGEVCPLGPFYLPAYGAGVRAGIKELGPHLLGEDPLQRCAIFDTCSYEGKLLRFGEPRKPGLLQAHIVIIVEVIQADNLLSSRQQPTEDPRPSPTRGPRRSRKRTDLSTAKTSRCRTWRPLRHSRRVVVQSLGRLPQGVSPTFFPPASSPPG